MDYKHIENFLGKFKKLVSDKKKIKETLIKIVSEAISCKVDKQAIRIKNGYIYIQESPILHSEVLVHKQQILEKIKEILPESNFIDIK